MNSATGDEQMLKNFKQGSNKKLGSSAVINRRRGEVGGQEVGREAIAMIDIGNSEDLNQGSAKGWNVTTRFYHSNIFW